MVKTKKKNEVCRTAIKTLAVCKRTSCGQVEVLSAMDESSVDFLISILQDAQKELQKPGDKQLKVVL